MDKKKNEEKENMELESNDQISFNTNSIFLEDEEFSSNKNGDNLSFPDDNTIIPDNDIDIEGNICNICYIEKEDLNNLECCKNTKKICNECLDCLKSPICPYCRQSLPEDMTKNILPSSCPTYFSNDWIRNESRYLFIDPEDPAYQDSRVLRREIRRMRRNYYRTRYGGGLYSKRERIHYRRSQRRQLRNTTRSITNQLNSNQLNSNYNTNEILDNLSFDDLFS